MTLRRDSMETFGVGIAGAGMIGAVHAEALDEIECALGSAGMNPSHCI